MIRVLGEPALKKTLMSFKSCKDIRFLMVDAPVFAYEPILRCIQDKTDLPLAKELLEYKRGDTAASSNLIPSPVLDQFSAANVQHILKSQNPVQLDSSQFESFTFGLKQSVSLIQGPPGKSISESTFSHAFSIADILRNRKVFCWSSFGKGLP